MLILWLLLLISVGLLLSSGLEMEHRTLQMPDKRFSTELHLQAYSYFFVIILYFILHTKDISDLKTPVKVLEYSKLDWVLISPVNFYTGGSFHVFLLYHSGPAELTSAFLLSKVLVINYICFPLGHSKSPFYFWRLVLLHIVFWASTVPLWNTEYKISFPPGL